MATIRVKLSVEVDGAAAPGFPIDQSISVDEYQSMSYEEAADNDTTTFSAVPEGQLANLQFLALTGSLPFTLRLDAQTDAGIILGTSGVILIIGGTIDAGAATNLTINNPHAATAALISGVAGGT